MKADVLIETAAGKTKSVKKALAKVKGARATVIAMDAVTGPYDCIAVVDGSSLDAIGNPTWTEAWVEAEVAAGRRIMGFGHAVYRSRDPRSALLRENGKDRARKR